MRWTPSSERIDGLADPGKFWIPHTGTGTGWVGMDLKQYTGSRPTVLDHNATSISPPSFQGKGTEIPRARHYRVGYAGVSPPAMDRSRHNQMHSISGRGGKNNWLVRNVWLDAGVASHAFSTLNYATDQQYWWRGFPAGDFTENKVSQLVH